MTITSKSIFILGCTSLILVLLLGSFWYCMVMPGKSFSGVNPLTAEEEKLKNFLRTQVHTLAGTIGPRNDAYYENLQQARDHIKNLLNTWNVALHEQQYTWEGKTFSNIYVKKEGAAKSHEILVVGAHYDSAFLAPGANDNASAVAALLALIAQLKDQACKRTIYFVFFVNEEPPHYKSNSMGSLRFAQQLKEQNSEVIGMLSLETIGYYSSDKNSQRYPFPFNLFYPNQGNFVGFVSNFGSTPLLRKSFQIFREAKKLPSEGAATFSWVTGVDWSDHWSFWQQGYRAIMITDTALFRYPYYHTAQDTPEKLNYGAMAQLVSGLETVILKLAND